MDLLQRAAIPFQQIDVAERQQQERLIARYQAASFPLVLVGNTYVGGYAHILHLHAQGRLSELLVRRAAADEKATGPATTGGAIPPPPSPRAAPSTISTMSKLALALNNDSGKKR